MGQADQCWWDGGHPGRLGDADGDRQKQRRWDNDSQRNRGSTHAGHSPASFLGW